MEFQWNSRGMYWFLKTGQFWFQNSREQSVRFPWNSRGILVGKSHGIPVIYSCTCFYFLFSFNSSEISDSVVCPGGSSYDRFLWRPTHLSKTELISGGVGAYALISMLSFNDFGIFFVLPYWHASKRLSRCPSRTTEAPAPPSCTAWSPSWCVLDDVWWLLIIFYDLCQSTLATSLLRSKYSISWLGEVLGTANTFWSNCNPVFRNPNCFLTWWSLSARNLLLFL